MKETYDVGSVHIWCWDDPLEEGKATHSSILAWRIPWTEEPGGLRSMGWQRVRHDWSDLAHTQPGILHNGSPGKLIHRVTSSSYCITHGAWALWSFVTQGIFSDPEISRFLSKKCVHAQSHTTLCYPMDCSPPGSSVHGILQARILEWVGISSSRRSYWCRDQTHVSCSSCTGRQIVYHWATWEALIKVYLYLSIDRCFCEAPMP